jgi:hypothetical protein
LLKGIFDRKSFIEAVDTKEFPGLALVRNAAAFHFNDKHAMAWVIQNKVNLILPKPLVVRVQR